MRGGIKMQNTVTDLVDKEEVTVDSKNAEAWTWALALVKAAGGSPTPDFLALAEREKRGEITTADMKTYLDRKYKVKESD